MRKIGRERGERGGLEENEGGEGVRLWGGMGEREKGRGVGGKRVGRIDKGRGNSGEGSQRIVRCREKEWRRH